MFLYNEEVQRNQYPCNTCNHIYFITISFKLNKSAVGKNISCQKEPIPPNHAKLPWNMDMYMEAKVACFFL